MSLRRAHRQRSGLPPAQQADSAVETRCLPADIEAVLRGERQWALVCADNADVLPELPDKSVQHVITDPPYRPGIEGKVVSHKSGRGFVKAERAFGYDMLTAAVRARAASEFARLAQRWVLLFTDLESVGDWRAELLARGLEYIRTGAWVRPNPPPQFTGDRPGVGVEAVVIAHPRGRKRWNGGGTAATWTHCQEVNGPNGRERWHPTPKPVSLMLELVELFSDTGDVVLDPFAGSATTGVACLRLGRRFVGIEKNPEFCAVAHQRLEAESQGMSLRDWRAGQIPLFGGAK